MQNQKLTSDLQTGTDPKIAAAANWLATGGADRSRVTVPQLRQVHSLTAKEACAAIRHYNRLTRAS